MATPLDIQGIAETWGVTTRTVHNWRHRFGDSVVSDKDALARVLLRDAKTPLAVRQAAQAIGSGDEMDAGVAAVSAINDLPDLRKRTESHLAAADSDIHRFRAAGDTAGEALAVKRYRELSTTLTGIIRAQALIGQDAGELIAKTDAKRIVHAWASRAALGIQRIRDQHSKKLIGLPDETAVWAALDDALISEMFLAPFGRAVSIKAGTNLPQWFVDEITRAVGDFVENGEQELREETNGHRVA